ncbi:MAG: sigma 54-interacting transcriptional regulator [Bacillota bacterium]|nr:sigma 54-interacting transcriptional regulator [Bacillota bacterium]
MSVIGTDESRCRKCYACIRECPVKATKVEDGRMRVVDEICVACGECLEACAVRARYSEDAVPLVESFLAEGSVIAILDPSFPAAFPTVTPGQVVAGLSALGFSEVHDTSLAVKRVLEAYRATLAQVAGEAAAGVRTTGEAMPLRSSASRISSMCPAVVRLVERHYPDLVGNLIPVVSPPVAAARAIRGALSGGEGPTGARIVFAGPCVAWKAEAAELGEASRVDAVLTFDELAAMFESRDIVLRDLVPRGLDGAVAPRERHTVFAGGLSWLMGMSKGLSDDHLVIAAGRSRCIEVMDDLARGALTPAFVDASMCRGCLDAPILRRRSSISVRKRVCRVFASGGEVRGGAGVGEAADGECDPGQVGYEASSNAITAAAAAGGAHGTGGAGGRQTIDARVLERTFKPGGLRLPIPSESEIAEILAFSGKLSPQDHLDCGMCGYPTCRAYAIAVYQNMARSDMCVQYLVDRLEDKVEHMKAELVSVRTSSFDDIYGASHQIRVAKDLAERAARSGSTVLLLGESGVGKEVFARAIHAASSRRGGPFVSVNCAAIPDNLMESELFGYVEGAFTGAAKGGKPGKFELASGGTIFLDEIGDMSLQLQAKLLRVLQTHKIERVGGTREIDVDVRVMAATNKDLKAMVEQGTFRLDLYYRLNVVTIRIPPLRERIEDIPLIISRSLAKLSARCPTKVTSVSPEALRILLDYDWPGNVRELENVLERALNLADGEVIEVEHLPEHVVSAARGASRLAVQRAGEALDDVVARAEQEALLEALKATNNNRSRAAKKLGISRSAFYEKLRKYKIAYGPPPQLQARP